MNTLSKQIHFDIHWFRSSLYQLSVFASVENHTKKKGKKNLNKQFYE